MRAKMHSMPRARQNSSILAVPGMTCFVHALMKWRPQIVTVLFISGERGAVWPLQIGVLNVDNEEGRSRLLMSVGSSGSGAPM